jgi:4,5-dihydroxyphthalate decarboxylase
VERVKLPPAVAGRVEYVGKEARLFDWLLEKKLDAVMYAHLTTPPVPAGAVRCLFPDAVEQEKKYFRKHGVIPLMHLLAIKEEHLAKGPGVARKVERVLRKEKESFFKRLEMVASAGVLPWFSEYVDGTAGTLGADPWPHGIEANRKGLEKFLDYSMAQGLISRRPDLRELFIDV